MQFHDALFNWLQIELVARARPQDAPAADTRDFFRDMLREDHGVVDLHLAHAAGEDWIDVQGEQQAGPFARRYPREQAEQLLHDINANPKYNEMPGESHE
ncbi:hypothetical protein IDH44_04400 [Paenibacillus sp. IB182496]|uniref:Uncharacterized protein n=1 Tax=Paenibacillus sabuli TaxID=2772509 RepID=A0A927BPN9_9BACL|nr:hypothetical protein [Paenibacillus sabuli]MBD2844421.1 hypothetical protein [Paenibacillus sabuli]